MILEIKPCESRWALCRTVCFHSLPQPQVGLARRIPMQAEGQSRPAEETRTTHTAHPTPLTAHTSSVTHPCHVVTLTSCPMGSRSGIDTGGGRPGELTHDPYPPQPAAPTATARPGTLPTHRPSRDTVPEHTHTPRQHFQAQVSEKVISNRTFRTRSSPKTHNLGGKTYFFSILPKFWCYGNCAVSVLGQELPCHLYEGRDGLRGPDWNLRMLVMGLVRLM